MPKKILIQGGSVVGGPSGPCDLLIEYDRIAAIAPSIAADDAEIVDAAGMLVAPGFVDTHRHIWQTGIRGVAADWSLVEYIRFIRLGYATAYRPEDVWISNYTGSLEALDAGITTVCDFCHIVRTPDHADAGLEGLSAAGIRAQFYYGFYDVPTDPPYFADHAARVAHARHAPRRPHRGIAGFARGGAHRGKPDLDRGQRKRDCRRPRLRSADHRAHRHAVHAR